jgi:(p)ppGpp synthase/HD superfamily hydrolase
LAATVHSGQLDKAGAPYILHPRRMMLKMKTVETQMAAVLHDVMEDCGVTPALLAHGGFPASVIEAVGALPKRIVEGTEEPYEEFIRRAAQNPISRLVKLADLEDNMDLSRLAPPTAKDFARIEKYKLARAVIERAISGADPGRSTPTMRP